MSKENGFAIGLASSSCKTNYTSEYETTAVYPLAVSVSFEWFLTPTAPEEASYRGSMCLPFRMSKNMHL